MSSSITDQQAAAQQAGQDISMDKGKGKAEPETEEDDSSDEEMGDETIVSFFTAYARNCAWSCGGG